MNRIVFSFLLVYLSAQSVYGGNPPAEILNSQTIVRLEKGRLVKSYSYDILVNEREGDYFGEISIPYSPMRKLMWFSAQILDARGNVLRKVKKGDGIDRSSVSSISLYEDDMVREYKLRNSRYPYRIQYTYTVELRQYFLLEHWTPVEGREIPTRQASLEIIVPSTEEIRWKSLSAGEPAISKKGGETTYRWDQDYAGDMDYENYSVSGLEIYPSVIAVPVDFYFEEQGSNSSWMSFGNWVYELIRGEDELPELEKRRIHNEIEGVKDDLEKIHILFNRLQDETRYINIAIETGGLKPYPASYVAEKKYGDCKALSNYFKAVLKEAGIESFYTLVSSGSKVEKIIEGFPFQQFDHAILLVPLEGDSLWLDCTSDYPFGYTGTFIQGRKVLVVKENESHLTTIPALTVEDVLTSRKGTFLFEGKTTLKEEIYTSFNGPDFEDLHYYHTRTGQDFKQYVVRNYFVSGQLSPGEPELIYDHRDSTSIHLSLEVSSTSLAKLYGEEIVLKVLELDIPEFEKPEYRKLPVQLDFPIALRDSFLIHPPPGFTPDELPPDIHLDTSFGTYDFTCKTEGKDIIVDKKFILFDQRVDTALYGAFYKFISTISMYESNRIVVFKK